MKAFSIKSNRIWLLATGISVAIIGSVAIIAQTQPPSQLGAPVAMPGQGVVTPQSLPLDPTAPIPFSQAPHQKLTRFSKRDSAGRRIEYVRFISKAERTYVVEMPAELMKQPRSKDEWVTLFACYGVDHAATADVRRLQGGAQDTYSNYITGRISVQASRVTATREYLARRLTDMTLWATIHQEAKDNGDILKARRAWEHISNAKYDIKIAMKRLAQEKLELGELYKQSANYEQARVQYRQTADLLIFPYSAQAISKLRAIEGATAFPAQHTTATLVGLERISLSDLFRATGKAVVSTP